MHTFDELKLGFLFCLFVFVPICVFFARFQDYKNVTGVDPGLQRGVGGGVVSESVRGVEGDKTSMRRVF